MLPSYTVNVMSNEEDQCFQCQELGHITSNCPNVHCFECDKYGHIVADCPDTIPPSGTFVHHKRQHTRHHARTTSRHHHMDRHRYSRSRSQFHSHRYRSHNHDNSCRSSSRSHHRVPDHTTDTTTKHFTTPSLQHLLPLL